MYGADHKPDYGNQMCLKKMCFQAVRKHFAAVSTEAVLDLPTALIKDLLPHLTVCQLDELQPSLNRKGISTYSEWVGILAEMCKRDRVLDFHTEEEAKHEVMRRLFTFVFYGFRKGLGLRNGFVNRNAANLNTPSFLWAAANCIRRFLVIASLHEPFHRLTAEQRPVLNLLEKHVRIVDVSQFDVSKKKTQAVLYVLHRLIDHGAAKELIVDGQCPIMLVWLLHGRGSQYVDSKLVNLMHSKCCTSQTPPSGADGAMCTSSFETKTSDDMDDKGIPCKLSKLDNVEVDESDLTLDPQVLCQAFTPCDGSPAGVCSWGQIESLEIRQCSPENLRVLNSSLPTFFSLRSLTLHSISTFTDLDVFDMARALKQLSESSSNSLVDLSISVLPHIELMDSLLDASPNLTSLCVKVQTFFWAPHFAVHPAESELRIEKLTIKVAQVPTDLDYVTSVLKRSPHLASLHVAGLRPLTGSSQSQLLTTLAESNRSLRSLNLEDLNLSECLPEILKLLKAHTLEELRLNDCRLLEKWTDKQEGLQQLVAALKAVPSLHTLGMAQNRLAPTSSNQPSCWSSPRH
ncbi:uncharacterized protein lrrc41 isoform 2-T2 [Aulostomus maculatus]